jgi:hypothetical protein
MVAEALPAERLVLRDPHQHCCQLAQKILFRPFSMSLRKLGFERLQIGPAARNH